MSHFHPHTRNLSRLSVGIYAFILILSCLSGTRAQFIQNSGFETGSLSPWTSWEPGGEATIVSDQQRTGSRCIRLRGREVSIEQQITGLTPNTAYVLEGWIKVEGFGQSVRLGIDNAGGAGGGFAMSSALEYTKVSVRFTTGPTNTTAKVFFYKPNIGSLAYGDDFSIREDPAFSSGYSKTSFTPDRVSLLRNPGMGWTLYDDAADEVANAKAYWDHQGANAEKYASVFYVRWRWAEMEPEEGKYAWLYDENFKALIKGATDRKLKLAFRIYPDGQDNVHQATPQYVFDAGARWYETTHTHVATHKNPYLDDPIFQEKFSKFIHAFAEEFDDPAVVDYIDGYNFGFWGEGHNERYLDGSYESRESVAKWVFDLYGNSFKRVIPVVITNIMDNVNFEMFVGETFAKHNYVPRRDGLGSMYVTDGERWLHDKLFPAAMFVGEQCYWGGNEDISPGWKPWVDQIDWKYNESSTWIDTYRLTYEDAINSHANYLDLREAAETDGWVKGAPELVQGFVVRGGYRLYPSEITMPSNVTSGQTFTLQHDWKNIGVGVCPNNNKHWNHKYKVAFAFIEPSTGLVKKMMIDPIANPANWIESSNNGYRLDISTNDLVLGNYVFAVAIVNSEDEFKPEIKLAIENPVLFNGWVKLTSVKVEESAEKLNYYRSTGDVDLGTITNWEVFDGEQWGAATEAPSNFAKGILIQEGHRWSNNSGVATGISEGVTLIVRSSLFGTFDETQKLTNRGTVTFAGKEKQSIPGAKHVEGGSWGNITIDNEAGVDALQSDSHLLRLKKLHLVSGLLSVLSTNDAAVFLDDELVVDEGKLVVEGSNESTGTVHLSGKVRQTIPTQAFRDQAVGALIMDNEEGVALQGPLAVQDGLAFKSGKLILRGDDLSVEGGITGASASSYVVTEGLGGLKIKEVGGEELLFPVGHSLLSYTPLRLTNQGEADYFTVRVTNTLPTGATVADPSRVVPIYWDVSEEVEGGSEVSLKLQWNDEELKSVPDVSMSTGFHVLGHFTNGSWATQLVSIAGEGPFTTQNKEPFSSFSPFGVGMDGAFDDITLPVRLLSFSGKYENRMASLSWATTEEIDLSHFEVQQSQNARDFVPIGRVHASGGGSYRYTDATHESATRYYRLKSVDLDGKFSYSAIILLVNDASKEMFVHPNPVLGSQVKLSHQTAGKNAWIQLVGGDGRVYSKVSVQTGTDATQLNLSDMLPGVYWMVFVNDGVTKTIRIIR
jgi:hypothetical protein